MIWIYWIKDLRPIFNNSRIKMENRNNLYNNSDIIFEKLDLQTNLSERYPYKRYEKRWYYNNFKEKNENSS